MFLSLILILGLGFLAGKLFEKMHLPPLLAMIIVGIILGPDVLNVLDNSLLKISGEIRAVALLIILTRAGLKLNKSDFKKIGRPAGLLSFLPATFEILSIVAFAPLILKDIDYIDAAIMGSVLAAVSPAVIVPSMIKIMDKKYGFKKRIPQLILAGASIDDIYVIVIFTIFLKIKTNNTWNWWSVLQIPLSIILGIGIGILFGYILSLLFKKLQVPTIPRVIILFSISLILFWMKYEWKEYIPMDHLLAVLAMALTIKFIIPKEAEEDEKKYKKMWVVGEILLFVLVGAEVRINSISNDGGLVVAIVSISLCFRLLAVYFSLIKTGFNLKEKIFCMIAYIPKATVQAAIGAIALSSGLKSGAIILTAAVVSILFTAPIGSILIEFTYKHLLSKNESENVDSNVIQTSS